MLHTTPRPTLILFLAAGLSACSQQRLANADRAYDRMAYAKASQGYERYLDREVERDVALRAADSYRRQNECARSEHWYAVADSIAPLNADQRFELATMRMRLGMTEKAGTDLLMVLHERPEDQAAMDLYASCQGYKSFYADTTHFTVAQLPIPGADGLFSAMPYRNGLLVVSDHRTAAGGPDPWSGGSFLDICYTERRTLANWSVPEPIPGKVNGAYHEGPMALSPNGRTLYFTRSNYYKVKLRKNDRDVSHLMLFRADLDSNGNWGNIRAFAYNDDDHSIGHPALSADGRTLYFASDMQGSLGGSDIWKCIDTGRGWGPPENLGPTVNTPGNELFPTVNGQTLYFSSTAHENMGGLDIFSTHPEGDGWSEPRNMGYPLNTAHDDMGLMLTPDERAGYLSSDRSGADRIHYFVVNEPVLFVEGTITDDSTSAFLPMAEVTLTDLTTLQDTSTLTGHDGAFRFPLEPGTEYRLRVTGADRIAVSTTISTHGLVNNTTFREDFALAPITVGDHINVANIYYDYDEWDIRPDAAVELDRLVKLLRDNPAITFELGSHTDSRGGDLYNLVLSDARANSAVNYLIQHGVDPDRIKAQGYGEGSLINGCGNGINCPEEEHQANRRTEFKVLRIDRMAGK